MKISTTLPFDRLDADRDLATTDAVRQIGAALESAGFAGASVTDHPVPTKRWLDAGGHHAQDPFALLGMLAAVTSTAELQTGILVLPYRNPFLTARAASTLDRFSGGRLALGIGAGYLRGEFRALGVDFERRNELTDEYLQAMKLAWTGEEFSVRGTGYEAHGNQMLPTPQRRPYPTLLIGGNSRRALRRAVEHGDAWNPFLTDAAVAGAARTAMITGEVEIAEGIRHLHQISERIGRAEPPAVIVTGLTAVGERWNADELLTRIDRLARIGVTGVGVQVSGRSIREWCDEAERFGREVIARLA